MTAIKTVLKTLDDEALAAQLKKAAEAYVCPECGSDTDNPGLAMVEGSNNLVLYCPKCNDPLARTRAGILALFQKVLDGEMSPEEATEEVIQAVAAAQHIKQQEGGGFQVHTLKGLVRS